MVRNAMKAMVVGLFALGLASSASAHTWAKNGSVSVLLHTNPDDDVIAGEPSALLVGISDGANHFNPDLCQCTVTVSLNGDILLGKTLLPWFGGDTSLYTYLIPFTFPNSGAYRVVISGNPKSEGAFDRFEVSYDVRVGKNPGAANASPIFGITAAGTALLVLGMLYFCYREIRS